ncbi:MAG: hypothetical protein PHC49_18450 [Desulfuromonadaceae bacterium]|nr:hypothetical protein [Desulfuromonadaceae bacterium]
MVTRLFYILLLISVPLSAQGRDYWEFPDAAALPDSARILVYDPTLPPTDVNKKSRNITGSKIKELLKGDPGAPGAASTVPGPPGADSTVPGPPGTDAPTISSVARTSGTGAPGTTDTYTILLSNGATHAFTVYNGANGADSIVPGPPGDNGRDGADSIVPGPPGADAPTISSVVRTSGTGAPGTTDTYTITLSNGSTHTFTVYNGANGADSTVPGPPGSPGSPDTQSEILGKLAAPVDGAVLKVQQGPSEPETANKIEVRDTTGALRMVVTATGAIRIFNTP